MNLRFSTMCDRGGSRSAGSQFAEPAKRGLAKITLNTIAPGVKIRATSFVLSR